MVTEHAARGRDMTKSREVKNPCAIYTVSITFLKCPEHHEGERKRSELVNWTRFRRALNVNPRTVLVYFLSGS